MVEININNIDKEFLKKTNNEVLKVDIDNLDFCFKLSLKENSDKLIVFSNGAVDVSKSTPPVFMRHTWEDEFDDNCLFIDDRTIHGNNLKIGWGVGTEDRHFLKDYNKFINQVTSIIEVENENIFYYGSSAGGFMSIAMASANKGSSAIVNNPQTYVSRYDKISVEKLYNTIFPGKSRKEIFSKYSTRLSLINIMSRNKNVPRIYYLQNRLCKNDMINQLQPFIRNMEKYKMDSSKINYILYNNKSAGHNPLKKNATIRFIKKTLDKKTEILY